MPQENVQVDFFFAKILLRTSYIFLFGSRVTEFSFLEVWWLESYLGLVPISIFYQIPQVLGNDSDSEFEYF